MFLVVFAEPHVAHGISQAFKLAASQDAEEEVSSLRAQLEEQRSLLHEVSSAARELAAENEYLSLELSGLRDAKQALDTELSTLKVRASQL